MEREHSFIASLRITHRQTIWAFFLASFIAAVWVTGTNWNSCSQIRQPQARGCHPCNILVRRTPPPSLNFGSYGHIETVKRNEWVNLVLCGLSVAEMCTSLRLTGRTPIWMTGGRVTIGTGFFHFSRQVSSVGTQANQIIHNVTSLSFDYQQGFRVVLLMGSQTVVRHIRQPFFTYRSTCSF